MKCIERNIEPYDVMVADEAFVTGTPFCMLPVTKINGLNIGNGQVGAIYKKLLSKWSQNVGIDIEAQIKAYSEEVKNIRKSGPTPYRFKSED
jgi:branched-chain amino acid aminotransferase